MALYGHEITENIDPLSAGLGFAVKLDKGADDARIGHFVGQDALKAIAAAGPERTRVGLVLDSPRAARQNMTVKLPDDDTAGGVVTSGCLSPTLERSIAMAYVASEHAAEGTALAVNLGRQTVAATIVPLPFYRRA